MVTVALFVLSSSLTSLPNPWVIRLEFSCIQATFEFDLFAVFTCCVLRSVFVTFWSACPKNDLMTEGTLALVELLQDRKTWIPAYDDDDDFCLRFKWSRPAKLSPQVVQP
ncbi:hypothetical protein REPUB_Repub06bG0208600 [Reevesia pubescens]